MTRRGSKLLHLPWNVGAALLLVGLAFGANAQTNELSRARAMVIEVQRLISSGDLHAAEHEAENALAIYETLPNDNALAVFGRGNANYLLGEAFHRAGQNERALEHWGTAVQHYQLLEGRAAKENLLETLTAMLPLLVDARRTTDTLEILAAIPPLQAELGRPAAAQAQSHSNVGVMLMRVGRLHEAERELDRAVALSRQERASYIKQSEYLYNLGLVHNRLEDFQAAQQNFHDSLDLLKPIPGQSTRRAEILLDLSNSLKEEGKPAEARRELEGALKLVGSDPASRLLRATLLNNLANDSFDRLGRKKEAMDGYRQALQLVRGRTGAEEIEAAAISNIAKTLSESGAINEAIGMYSQVLAKQEAASTSTLTTGKYRKELSVLLLKAGRRAEALQNLLIALRIEWDSLTADLPALTSIRKQIEIDKRAELLDPIYAIAFTEPQSGGTAYEATLLMKALYSESIRNEHIVLRESASPETRAKQAHYLELRHEISSRILDPSSSQSATTGLAAEAQRLELELRQDPSVFRAEGRLTAQKATDVTARLREGDVLLDYVAYQGFDLATLRKTSKRYGVFVVDGTSARVVAVDLGDRDALDEVIGAFRKLESIQADPVMGKLDEDELASAAEAVRRYVLDPAISGIPRPKRIYIAPDGALGLIPFEALPVRRNGDRWRYVVEDTEIVYLLTGRDLTRQNAVGAEPSNDIWLVGDPAYDATLEQRVAAAGIPSSEVASVAMPTGTKLVAGATRLPDDAQREVPADWIRLEGTRRILAAAADAARRAGLAPRILLDASASEETVYAIRRPRALLFATHGYFMADPPSALFEYKREGGKSTINPDLFESTDPLQRSMLILAGANHRKQGLARYAVGNELMSESEVQGRGMTTEQLALARRELGDGLMTAYEVMGMDLAGTQLVVLTACESGLGVPQGQGAAGLGQGAAGLAQAQGESVAGLRQAFTIAGAQSLVMSLWLVPLNETATQMKSFLDGWLSHRLPPYQAFHASQLAALEIARRTGTGHPFWWAGFIYAGDPGDR